jgi:hypothetical protein
MRDVRQYWKQVSDSAAALPEFVWLAKAGGDPALFAVQAPAAIAARLLVAKTHRLAEPGEIDAQLAREAAFERSARAEQRRRKGTAVVAVRKPAAKPRRASGKPAG